jgi:hypothetical protein
MQNGAMLVGRIPEVRSSITLPVRKSRNKNAENAAQAWEISPLRQTGELALRRLQQLAHFAGSKFEATFQITQTNKSS